MGRFYGVMSIVAGCALAGCAAEAPAPQTSSASPAYSIPVAGLTLTAAQGGCPEVAEGEAAPGVSGLSDQFDHRQKCRLSEAQQVIAAYRAGKVGRADAAASMILLRGMTRQDVTRTRAALRRFSANNTERAALIARLSAAETEANRLGNLDG